MFSLIGIFYCCLSTTIILYKISNSYSYNSIFSPLKHYLINCIKYPNIFYKYKYKNEKLLGNNFNRINIL